MLRLLPLVALIAAVTLASAQTAKESDAVSGRVARFVIRTVAPGFDQLSRSKQRVLVRNFNNKVREWAHGFLFMLVAMAMLIALGAAAREPVAQRMILAYGLTMIAAVADETHQIFVDGRGFELLDVLVDWGGAGLGVMLSGGVAALFAKRRARPTR